MAYRSLEREASFAYGSSHTCLDGVPFKISPQFKVPTRVTVDADFIKCPRHPHDEYNFEIEEGVMKWAEERERAAERERQLQAQKLEEELRAGNINRGPITIHDSDSESEDPWLKNGSKNAASQPGSAESRNAAGVRERRKPPPRPPQPRGPVISNDILKPTQISTENNGNKLEAGTNKPVDVTLFETEDDPFDRFERQTLNDLEELKNVFQCSNQTTNSSSVQSTDSRSSITNASQPVEQNNYENLPINSSKPFIAGSLEDTNNSIDGARVNCAFSDSPQPTPDQGDYVTLKSEATSSRQSPQIDIGELPPIPPRRFITNNDPLPPINMKQDVNVTASQLSQSATYDNAKSVQPNPFGTDDFSHAELPSYENAIKPHFKPVDSNPTNYENINIQNGRVVFSKNESSLSHESLLKTADKDTLSNYVNVAPGAPLSSSSKRNAKSNPDITKTMNGVNISSDVFDKAPFPLPRSPPHRPSSQQNLANQSLYVDLPSWNKFTPLPSPSGVSKSSSADDFASQAVVDPYLRLSPENQEIVNNLVGMGFSRPRVARAVESFGCDGKVIVEHLCNVDKMSDAGFDSYQSELALVLFKNNKQKAEKYLNMYKQFQELGFSGDKIKEALMKFDNDGDKALDFLTA